MKKILVPLGTRPEIIKLAPVVHALRAAGFSVRTLATGQHTSPEMMDAFLDELGVRPDVRWALPDDEAGRLGAMLSFAHNELAERRPDVVLLLGDTYTVPLFGLAARRHAVPVVHIEAGLRSFNERSIEEVNRRTAAALASVHFAPTVLAATFLAAEGVKAERVHVVGNPVIDLVAGAGVRRRDPRDRRGVVLTAHRPTNVDDPARLAAIVAIAERLVAELGPVTFPVHPRTALRLRWAGLERRLDAAGVDACPPLPYRRMLEAVARAELVVTDSGGLQEEASWFGVPVLVVRRSTPRWEGVAAGVAKLVGLNAEQVVAAGARLTEPSEQRRIAETPCLYGDGKAARRIAGILADPRTDSLLELREPDFARTPSPRW